MRIIEYLKEQDYYEQLVGITRRVQPDGWIREIHAASYMDRLQDACEHGVAFIDCPDSAISPASYNVAREAVAVTLACCDEIMTEKVSNGFCALRPPGHHAEHDYSMGFCLFNNAAVAGRYLQKRHGLKRIFILDWDVHHGNGTQHTFERDPSVFYASLHQHPSTLFPGTGWAKEIGIDAGRYTTLNLPMEPGTEDGTWLDAFRKKVLPALDRFEPNFIIVSCGFDADSSDMIAEINLTQEAFVTMTQDICSAARRHCGGRLLSLLEGGYNLETLGPLAGAHVENLLDQS